MKDLGHLKQPRAHRPGNLPVDKGAWLQPPWLKKVHDQNITALDFLCRPLFDRDIMQIFIIVHDQVWVRQAKYP